MGSYLLGIDIGTSACKTALFHPGGGAVAVRECPYGVSYPQPGWAQQDPDDWWKAAVSGIRGVLEESGVRPADIAGIGVDGQRLPSIKTVLFCIRLPYGQIPERAGNARK